MKHTARRLRQHRWLVVVVAALLALTGLSESLAPAGPADPPMTRQQVLDRLPDEPDILVNVTGYQVPATADLVRLGNRATPALVNCLVHNLDPSVRGTCAQVLVATRDVRAIEPLVAALDDPDYRVRAWAIEALSHIEARPATPKLLAMVEAPYASGHIRREAMYALGRSGDPAAIDPLFAYFKRTWDASAQRALWDMRRQLSQDQLRDLILAPLAAPQQDVTASVRAFSIEQAGALGLTGAVDALVAHYDDAPPDTRNRIVYNLGLIGDARAVPLLEGLIDTTGEARLLNNVTFALQRLGVDVTPILQRGLADARAYIRYNTAFVTGDLGASALVPELIAALEDINDIVRSQAALALGRIGDPAATPALLAAARDDNPLVRRDAFLALLTIDPAAHRDAALAALDVARQSGDHATRQALLAALIEQPDPTLIPIIAESLDPTDWREASMAIAFFDRFFILSDPDALALLVRLAADGNHDAFRLLARFADPRTAFLFEQWLLFPGGEAEQVLRGLARLGVDGRTEAARAYFARDGSAVQLYAAFYLASTGDEDAMALLLAALEAAPLEQKRTVARILTELDFRPFDGAEQTLLALLEHRDVYVRLYAAHALAFRGVQAGVEQLRVELAKKIPFIRDEVLDIVDAIPEKERLPLLKQWASSADPMLRRELDRRIERLEAS